MKKITKNYTTFFKFPKCSKIINKITSNLREAHLKNKDSFEACKREQGNSGGFEAIKLQKRV